MGWRFRRRLRFGPVQFELTGRGVGISVGKRGVHFGISARGNPYVSFGIPGTGLWYTKVFPMKSKGGKRRPDGTRGSD